METNDAQVISRSVTSNLKLRWSSTWDPHLSLVRVAYWVWAFRKI
jgi:hypothetical protein